MVATTRHPTYLLNKYVWALLKANTNMTEMDYSDSAAPSGRVPIVPSGQDSALNAINKPFLIYGYSEDTTPDIYAMRAGAISYAVWSTSVSEINNILNIIKAGMERHDEAARAVNKYTTNLGGTNIGIRFTDIYIGYHEGPSPEETEGGRQVGIITLRYQYAADYEVTLPV